MFVTQERDIDMVVGHRRSWYNRRCLVRRSEDIPELCWRAAADARRADHSGADVLADADASGADVDTGHG